MNITKRESKRDRNCVLNSVYSLQKLLFCKKGSSIILLIKRRKNGVKNDVVIMLEI